MQTKLLPHQKKGVKKLEHFKGRALLADEMQLGKTIQALTYVKRHKKKRPVVVVCPAISKWVWEQQAREHVNMRATILEGTKPPKRMLLNNHSILILNYEILSYWKDHLLKLKPKVLIIDECHYAKNPRAKRTKQLQKLGAAIPHIIAISGTPLVNRPVELWPTIHLLRPDIFDSFLKFAWKYCKPRLMFGKWKYDGAANLKELHHLLKKHLMIRRLKKDVLKELAPKTRVIIPLGIKNRKEYREADEDLIKWLSKTSKSKAFKARKAKRLIRFGYLKRLSAELKIKNVCKWLDNYLESTDDKIVVFAIHQKIIKHLHKKYRKISVVIDGSQSGKKKKIAEKTFKRSKKIRMLIGNIQAAGVSISLSKKANVVAFVELGFTPGEHTQGEDRIHGIGQKKKVIIYYLVARGTIEEDLCKLIQTKQKTSSSVLDGSSEVNTLNIFEELEKRLRRRTKKKR